MATTAMGETTSDWLNGVLGPAIAIPLMLIALTLAMRRQFRADRYDAWTYWAVVVMVAIFGHLRRRCPPRRPRRPLSRLDVFYAVVLAAILTRPLGASVADWAAVEPRRGGLGIGAGGASLVLAAVVFLLIRRLAKTKVDVRGSRTTWIRRGWARPRSGLQLQP